MTTLTEFVLARCAEREAVAREIIAEMVRVAPQYLPGAAPDPDDEGIHASSDNDDSPAVVVGPAHVLAWCETVRRLVGRLSGVADHFAADTGVEGPFVVYDCLLALALPDRAHPDYDPAWTV